MNIQSQPENVTLTSSDTGAVAQILVGFGCNCYSFRPVVGGKAIETLWSEDGFETGQKRASSSGIPILFPFPGRIQGTTLHWNSDLYELKGSENQGNSIHGFVLNRPWRTTEQTDDSLTAEFQASTDDPSLLEQWPADFRIQMTFKVAGNSLTIDTEVNNPGDTDLPCGLGLHPYFRVPLGGSHANDCTVAIPANTMWEMNDMIATGKQLPMMNAEELQAGVTFGGMTYDNGFGDLNAVDGVVTAEINDPNGARLAMSFSSGYREIVVYNPPHRQAVCVEPYTCVCDPFRLQREGFDAGLRVLAPGESFRENVTISVDQ